MKLYVYRISDHEYGAGLGRAECEQRGPIVEQWPLDTIEQVKFLKGHGTSFAGVTGHVSKIADLVYELMRLDQTFRSEPEEPVESPKPIDTKPAVKPGLLQRIKSWF